MRQWHARCNRLACVTNPLDSIGRTCNARVRDIVCSLCGCDTDSVARTIAVLPWSIRAEVARVVIAEHASPRLVCLLARLDDSRVRLECARSEHASHSTLSALAKDACPEVRFAVAANKRTLASTLVAIADDPNPSVRFRLACRGDLPSSLRAMMAVDSNAAVRMAALHGGSK